MSWRISERLSYAYQLALARQPDAIESERLSGYLNGKSRSRGKILIGRTTLPLARVGPIKRSRCLGWSQPGPAQPDEFLTRE